MEEVENGDKEMKTPRLFGGFNTRRDDLYRRFGGMRAVMPMASRTLSLLWTKDSVSILQSVIIEKINRCPCVIASHLNILLLSLLLGRHPRLFSFSGISRFEDEFE